MWIINIFTIFVLGLENGRNIIPQAKFSILNFIKDGYFRKNSKRFWWPDWAVS